MTGLRTGTERVFIDHAVLRQSPDPRIRTVLDVAVEIGHSVGPATFRFGDVVYGEQVEPAAARLLATVVEEVTGRRDPQRIRDHVGPRAAGAGWAPGPDL